MTFEGHFEGDEDENLFDDEFEPMCCVLVTERTKWTDARCSCAPKRNTDVTHINSFAELDDGVEELPEPTPYESLNNWAHAVINAKSTTSQKARKSNSKNKVKAEIKTIEDLDIIKALPTDFAALAKIAKNHPGNHLLKPGEQWMIMDTGANVDAADILEHFPQYAHLIEKAAPDEIGAECASGDVVKCRGKVKVTGSFDGQRTSIQFRDMKIKMPIGSMKKRIEGPNGFDTFITNGGAIMRHRATGKLVKLYDRSGVYFAKFKTALPPGDKDGEIDSLFGRLG